MVEFARTNSTRRPELNRDGGFAGPPSVPCRDQPFVDFSRNLIRVKYIALFW
jgi:hypothetical protein